jgi:FKBP-type peptidyl-prolyl cis-trans isomerase
MIQLRLFPFLFYSELMSGALFEIDFNPQDQADEVEEEIQSWDDNNEEDLKKNQNPCTTSFAEWREKMECISEGVYKKVLKKAPAEEKLINLKGNRVVYHRNFFMEDDVSPFDSTYLNGKPDEFCLSLQEGSCLTGVFEALSSMKIGERSLFIVDYKKMFREMGCPPRVS